MFVGLPSAPLILASPCRVLVAGKFRSRSVSDRGFLFVPSRGFGYLDPVIFQRFRNRPLPKMASRTCASQPFGYLRIHDEQSAGVARTSWDLLQVGAQEDVAGLRRRA